MIGHERHAGSRDDRGAAAFGGRLGIVADCAGMGRVMHDPDAHAGRLGALDRDRNRLRHRDRAGGAARVEHEPRRRVDIEMRPGLRVHVARLDHLEIARHAHHAVAVAAA